MLTRIELWTEVWPANVTCVHCKHHIESYFVILVFSCCEEIGGHQGNIDIQYRGNYKLISVLGYLMYINNPHISNLKIIILNNHHIWILINTNYNQYLYL